MFKDEDLMLKTLIIFTEKVKRVSGKKKEIKHLNKI